MMNSVRDSSSDQAGLENARDLCRRADDLYNQGDYAASQSLLEQALAIQERVLGENHLDHVELLKKLAKVRKRQGQYNAVLPLVQRIVDIHVQVLGPGHPMTALALGELMSQSSYEHGLGAALPIGERILKSMQERLGPDDPFVGMARASFDLLQAMQGQSPDAVEPPSRSRSGEREHALATLSPDREALLAGLDEIDWHSLHHAYGPADDVPDLLRLLLSDDATVRDDAWEELYTNVWHQGTVYEATAYTVPFLLKMLAYDGPPGKRDLLHFLSALAQGSSYLDVHARSDEDRLSWQEVLARQGRGDLTTELQRELAWVDAANRAVGEEVPIYFDLLEHRDAEIRHLSLYTLAHLRGRTAEIVPRLQTVLPTLKDAEMRAGAARALHHLMDDGVRAQQFFADLMQRGESEKTTFIAAVALAKRAREQTPETAVGILLDALRESYAVRDGELGAADEEAAGEAVEPRWDPADVWEHGVFRLTVDALVCLGQARAVEALLSALPIVQDGENALELAGTMLDLVFNDGRIQAKSTAISLKGEGEETRLKIEYWEPQPRPPRQASSLTPGQSTVLAALLAHRPFWEHQHNLLALYGLPVSRTKLRQFIARR